MVLVSSYLQDTNKKAGPLLTLLQTIIKLQINLISVSSCYWNLDLQYRNLCQNELPFLLS
jgi:hypothetical protein